MSENIDNSIREKNEILHKNADFLDFLTTRPHFSVKYNRKKSDKYRYIGPTITRE